jgi:replicative DNA helicase
MNGILPPQRIDIEEGLLSQLISYNKEIYNVNSILKPKHFYKDQHRIIYESILDLSQVTKVDFLQLISNLKDKGQLESVGGHYYITQLASKITGTIDTESYAKIIIEKWMAREIIHVCNSVTKEAYNDMTDSFDLLADLQTNVMNIQSDIEGSVNQTFENIVDEFCNDVINIKLGVLNGQQTGLKEIDAQFGGYKKGKMYVIAGRPGQGKTAYIVNNIFNLLKEDKKVVLHNLEMPNTELFSRLLGLYIKESPSLLSKGKIQDTRAYEDAVVWFKTRKFYIFNNSNLSNIILNTKMVLSTTGADAIFIDYIQLVVHKQKAITNRNEELTIISRTIKSFAVSENLPMIALAQLSRAVEQRPDKIPMLSDLRESGAIEQDADVVQFLYRPEYYGIEHLNTGAEDVPSEGLCLVITGKHRGGPTEDVLVRWDGLMNKFSDYNDTPKQQFTPINWNEKNERDFENEQEPF